MKAKSCLPVLAALAGFAIPLASFGTAKEGQADADRQQTAPARGIAAMPEKMTELGKVRLVFEGGEAIAELYDNPTSRDLASMLPLTLKFSDYNGVEKIAYPSRKLSTENAPFGLTPSEGDFALYAPWGNLVAYYRGFSHSRDLVLLGRFSSGIKELAKMDRDFSVRIEAMK